MTIHIDNLHFDAIIGLLDFEREHTQKIRIDLTLDYNYNDRNFIDYADLCTLIETTIKEGRYELLEEALIELEMLILTSHPQVKKLYLKISKLNILSNATAALSQQWHY